LHRCMLREFESTAPLDSGTHVDVLIPLHRYSLYVHLLVQKHKY
jgi:hypothetical protein